MVGTLVKMVWQCRELSEKMRKNSIYKKQKEGQITKEQFINIACICKDDIGKAKVQNELSFMKDAKNNDCFGLEPKQKEGQGSTIVT